MTTPFEQLREQAATKRDKAIQAARDEYSCTIREIQAMARKMGAPLRKSPKAGVFSCIAACIPPGEPFSIGSIFEAIQARFPERDIKLDYVKRCLLRLKESRYIRLVGRNDSGGPVYLAGKVSQFGRDDG